MIFKIIKSLFKILLVVIVVLSIARTSLLNSYKRGYSKGDIIYYDINGVFVYETCIPTWDTKIGIYREKVPNSIDFHFKSINYVKKENRKAVILWIGDIDFDGNVEIYIYDYISKKNIFFEITKNQEVLEETSPYTIILMKTFVKVGFLTSANFLAMFDDSLRLDLNNFYGNYWNGW